MRSGLPTVCARPLPQSQCISSASDSQVELLRETLTDQYRVRGPDFRLGEIGLALDDFLLPLGCLALATVQRHIIAIFVLFMYVVLYPAQDKLHIFLVLCSEVCSVFLQLGQQL